MPSGFESCYIDYFIRMNNIVRRFNMIYTSYFANMRNVDSVIAPVAVCLYPPKGWNGFQYKDLAPSPQMLSLAKSGHMEEYEKQYRAYLETLDVAEVFDDLMDIAYNNDMEDVVLLCFEKKGDPCHRNFIREWFNNQGYDCEEL